jgi:hypothetical protein
LGLSKRFANGLRIACDHHKISSRARASIAQFAERHMIAASKNFLTDPERTPDDPDGGARYMRARLPEEIARLPGSLSAAASTRFGVMARRRWPIVFAQ